MTQPKLRRNERPARTEKDQLNALVAANRARNAAAARATVKSYAYDIKPPVLGPGVAPSGVQPPVLAMDSNHYQYLQQNCGHMVGFPGFSYLAQLSTRAEYRGFASALSTEITREWIEFTSAEDDDSKTAEKIKAIEAEFKRLDVRGVLQAVVANDSYFGRGQIFMRLKGDENGRRTPLVLDPRTVPVGSLEAFVSIEPIWTTPTAYNALDPAAPDFYKPNSWFMLGQEVHSSRLLTVVTRPVSDILKPAFNFAGMSLSQLAEPYVDNWLRTRQGVADIIDMFSTTVLGTDMAATLQGDDDGTNLFARVDMFTAMRSNRGCMVVDKEREELTQLNTPLSGLAELQSQSQLQMCTVSRIPSVILTGISPSGLNATSEGEIRVFYDWISAQQEAFYRAPLETMLKVVQLSLFGEIDEDIGFTFIPLYQMDPEQEAAIRKSDSERDVSYVTAGVLDPSEVRERLARDPDSGYHGLDTDAVIMGTEDNEDEPDAAQDASVSAAQHRAMEAAAHGHSTLGIPKSVGEEFVKKDAE